MPRFFLLAVSILTIGTLLFCEKPSDPDTSNACKPSGILEITAPVGGTYAVGDTVAISWKAVRDEYSGFTLHFSLNNGITWNDITAGWQVSFKGTDAYECLDTIWIIGTEPVPPAYAATDTALIQLRNYGDDLPELRRQTEPITITQ
jgi:hypothetical protein